MAERADLITLPVAGMTCGGCVSSVTRALGGTAGVLEVVEVSLDAKSATVRVDPAQVDRARLVDVIESAGFDVPA